MAGVLHGTNACGLHEKLIHASSILLLGPAAEHEVLEYVSYRLTRGGERDCD